MTPGLGLRIRLGVALIVIGCAMPTAHIDAYSTDGTVRGFIENNRIRSFPASHPGREMRCA